MEFQDEELIICSAVILPDGYIIRGHRHHDCFRTIGGIPGYRGWKTNVVDQGFMTSRNRFVGRREAREIHGSGDHEDLYSEDLYLRPVTGSIPEPSGDATERSGDRDALDFVEHQHNR